MPSDDPGSEEILQRVADELRALADDLEDSNVELTEPVRYTQVAPLGTTLPVEIEVQYYDREHGVERCVEVWS